jgi:hypothetical protein
LQGLIHVQQKIRFVNPRLLMWGGQYNGAYDSEGERPCRTRKAENTKSAAKAARFEQAQSSNRNKAWPAL